MPQTDRLRLPLLSAAQAQKEMTHNEALTLLDAAVQPVVVAVAPAAVPAAPLAGECWIVGDGATGAWSGRDGALATWTGGGWRFLDPFEGMSAWSLADGVAVRYASGAWTTGALSVRTIAVGGQQVVTDRQPAIADPVSGANVDTEARAAISGLLDALRTHGLIEI